MKLPTEPYKGVRDFYPEDMYLQKYIFEMMRTIVESYGYEEYGASILEPTELYKAKSGEEIVNEQTYQFVDRGGRHVAIRPEDVQMAAADGPLNLLPACARARANCRPS